MLLRPFLFFACLPLSLSATVASAYEVDQKQMRVVISSVENFGRCQDDFSYSDACLDALKRYVKANPKAGFAAGKAVRARFNHWLALQFFVPTLSKATAEQQCADDDLRMAVLSGLALPDDEPGEALAVKAAEGVCAEKLRSAIRAQLGEGSAIYQRNACTVLGKQPDPPARCVPAAPAAKSGK